MDSVEIDDDALGVVFGEEASLSNIRQAKELILNNGILPGIVALRNTLRDTREIAGFTFSQCFLRGKY